MQVSKTNSALATAGSSGSAEMSILKIQLLMAKEFDDQLKHVADQIDMLGKVKKTYRERTNTLTRLLAKPSDSSRSDGQKMVRASASEMADLMGALATTNYSMETLEYKDTPMMLADLADKHELDSKSLNQIKAEAKDKANGKYDSTGKKYAGMSASGVAVVNADDKSSVASYADVFAAIAAETDPKVAMELAKYIPDYDKKGRNADLPFLFKVKDNNKDDKGFPTFEVLTESINHFNEELKNKLADVDQDSEKLATKLNQLMKMKEEAMKSASDTVSKLEQAKSKVISSMS